MIDMKIILNRYIALVTGMLLLLSVVPASGQKRQKQAKVTADIEVVDETGNPLGYSTVSSSKNRHAYATDADGEIRITIQVTDVLKVKASGYESKVISARDIRDGKLVVALEKRPEYNDEDHIIHTVTGDDMSASRTVGSYSSVEGGVLEESPTMFLYDALGGRLNGLFIMNNTLVPGFTNKSGFTRAPSGGMIVLVDGVERSLDYLEPETIESVQLLKDASLKSLYGGERANGILMITTRRGKAYENGVRVNVQSGVQIPTRLPQYLNSAQYAEAYNQALANVGKKPVYDPSKYDGSNTLLYPDVDFYDEFLNKFMTITRANAQLTGGSENTRYFLNLGFQTNGGYEKYTEYPNRDNVLTVRGNVDNTIFDFITLSVGINAAIQNKKWPNMSTQDFMGMLSTTRPNEFPITIPGEFVGRPGETVLGGTATTLNNPLGALTRNGFQEKEYTYMQSDFSINFDLDKWVKGLSIRPKLTFDFYNDFATKKGGGYSVYELIGNDEGEVSGYKNWGYDSPNTKQVRGASATNRNYVFSTTVKYDRSFGKHELMAVAHYFMQQKDFYNQIQGVRKMQIGAMANYVYDKKYIVEASASYVGVPAFAPGERFGLFPTVGAGWVISENDFMKEASWVDYLKLRASYGMLGSTAYDGGRVAHYFYRDEWNVGGSYVFNTFSNIVRPGQAASYDATFQKSHEFNAGADFEFFGHSLTGSVGYFRNFFDGGYTQFGSSTPGVVGNEGVLKWYNYNQVLSQGAEAELYYTKRFGDFQMTVGGNFSYGYSYQVREDDIIYPDELQGLAKVKRFGDSKGYRCIGTFKDQADIESSPVQTFGNVYPGDLKYADLNGDKVIDSRDREVIANTQPTMQYGITIDLKFKGFNLSVLGYGIAGFDQILTGTYYNLYGDRKYSYVLYDGLPNGNPHPVIRADRSTNNFVNSDYWVTDGGYFKLRNVEFGYMLPHKASKKIGLNSLKFFVRGTNLFTISGIKDLDPENLDAGVGNFPLCSTFTGGLSFSF